MSGTQVLRLIIESFRYTRSLRTFYTLEDALRLDWYGAGNSMAYLREANLIYSNLNWPDASRLELTLEHCEKIRCPELKVQIQVFKMKAAGYAKDDDPTYTYVELELLLKRYCEKKLLNKNVKYLVE